MKCTHLKMKISNKTALVTGGSRGIGKAIALTLASEGVTVILTYHRNRELAQLVVSEIKNMGGSALSIQLDQQEEIGKSMIFNEIYNKVGGVDILINNAGIIQEKSFKTITSNDFDTMIAVNLRGPFFLCQKVLPYMIQQGWGRIINIASIGGQWGGVNQPHYASAKAGLINLTKSLAKMYSKNGVTVNAVSPGLVDTDMIVNEMATVRGKEKAKTIPIGRIATPQEVANVVMFLASEKASYISGQTINTNGGMYV